jgi:hypothetical protein
MPQTTNRHTQRPELAGRARSPWDATGARRCLRGRDSARSWQPASAARQYRTQRALLCAKLNSAPMAGGRSRIHGRATL